MCRGFLSTDLTTSRRKQGCRLSSRWALFRKLALSIKCQRSRPRPAMLDEFSGTPTAMWKPPLHACSNALMALQQGFPKSNSKLGMNVYSGSGRMATLSPSRYPSSRSLSDNVSLFCSRINAKSWDRRSITPRMVKISLFTFWQGRLGL